MIRLLHVDDHSDFLELVAHQFKTIDDQFAITGVTTVEEAQKLLRKSFYDCILSDLQLPNRNGIELLKFVREIDSNLPFVFLTGQGNESLAASALRLGASDYYTKEVGFAQFERMANSVRLLVEGYRIKQENEDAQRTIRESERHLVTIIDNLPLAIVVLDREHNIVLHNEFFTEITEKSRKESLAGENFHKISSHFNTVFKQDIDAVFKTGKTSFAERTIEYGDTRIITGVKKVPIMRRGEVDQVLLVIDNITGYKLAEEALENSRKELENRVEERTHELKNSNEKLRKQITERVKTEKVQSVLYKIANAANSDMPLEQLYEEIHRILGKLLDVSSFYIALHEVDNKFTFPYYVDDFNEKPEGQIELDKSLTNFVFHNGEPLFVDQTMRDQLYESKAIKPVLTPAKIWMGVPLQTEDRAIGVMAVQTYSEETTFSLKDLDLLNFVSNQVALAIEHRRGLEELKQHREKLEMKIMERTHELATSYDKLLKGVRERERAETVQSVLFNVTDANLKTESVHDLLEIIHRQLENLFEVPNIFVALYDEKTGLYSFPYFVDRYDTIDIPDQRLPKTLTDYVRRRQEPLLLTPEINKILMSNKEIEIVGTPAKSWMGVPLISSKGAIGVLAIQSYDDEEAYTEDDLKLLDMVSRQIAFVVEKKTTELEVKNLFNDMQERNEELAVLNKELESFAYTVSHDLRSPLRHIIGFAQLIIRDHKGSLDKSGQAYIERIYSSCIGMNKLIDDLLKLSQASRAQIKRKHINVSAIVRSVANLLLTSEQKRKVKFKIADDIHTEADPSLLRIVFDNLIGNAWKFTRKQKRPKIEFGTRTIGDKEFFYVRDNGVGFDESLRDQLFVPFQRLHDDKEFEGSGIGLATVQRIVKRHNGDIWAENNKNSDGATFYFSIQ